jgi:hypothetical protein
MFTLCSPQTSIENNLREKHVSQGSLTMRLQLPLSLPAILSRQLGPGRLDAARGSSRSRPRIKKAAEGDVQRPARIMIWE